MARARELGAWVDVVICIALGVWVFLRLSRWSAICAIANAVGELSYIAYRGNNITAFVALFVFSFFLVHNPKRVTATGAPAVNASEAMRAQ